MREHTRNERSNLDQERDRGLFRARREVTHPAGERCRCDASVARYRPRMREERPGTRHGPLLVRVSRAPESPACRDRGSWRLPSRDTSAETDCVRLPAKGDGLRSIEVLFTVSEPRREDASSPGARPPFTPPLTLVWGIAHEGRAFFVRCMRRLALASEALRSGSVERTQAAFAALFRA